MTTLPLSFLLLVLETSLPEAVEAARSLNRGESEPDGNSIHPNFQDGCRVQLSQTAYVEIVDKVLVTEDEEDVAAVFDFFGLVGDNRDHAYAALLEGKTSTKELKELREAVSKIEMARQVLPSNMVSMVLGQQASYQPTIDRYNTIGRAIRKVSSLLVGKGLPVDEPVDEETGAEEGGLPDGFSATELEKALAEALSSGGAVAVDVGPDGVRVVATGSIDEVVEAAKEHVAERADAESAETPIEGSP